MILMPGNHDLINDIELPRSATLFDPPNNKATAAYEIKTVTFITILSNNNSLALTTSR